MLAITRITGTGTPPSLISAVRLHSIHKSNNIRPVIEPQTGTRQHLRSTDWCAVGGVGLADPRGAVLAGLGLQIFYRTCFTY